MGPINQDDINSRIGEIVLFDRVLLFNLNIIIFSKHDIDTPIDI